MKKKFIIGLIILSIIMITSGIILLITGNEANSKNRIEIIDATYTCNNSLEKFYENNKYTYFFPCVKSKSVYVKLANGQKMLIVDALSEEKVTIDELIAAGLNVYKEEK